MLSDISKKKKKDLETLDAKLAAAKAKLEKSHKKVLVTPLDEFEYDVEKIPTGIDAIDRACFGGLPLGRIIQIQGKSSVGKSSLLYYFLSLFDRGLLIDLEGVADRDRPEFFGCDPKKIEIAADLDYAEQALELMYAYTAAGIPVVGLDSIPSLVPKVEKDKDEVGYQRVGERARLLNTELPKLRELQKKTGTTIILLNQLRDDIGSMGFGDGLKAPGGYSLEHNSCLILKMKKGLQEKMTILGEEESIGQIIKARVEKSRVCPPKRTATFYLYFKYGFCDMSDRSEARKESGKIYREERKEEEGGQEQAQEEENNSDGKK